MCRTVADKAKDQPATDYMIGHESPHMSTGYRERISDERLRAVANHVHAWLFPPTREEKPNADAQVTTDVAGTAERSV
jgi:hypothetical protein